jgi:type VI secretion system protein ImpA
LDERVSKFEWLNNLLPQALKEIPLTAPEYGGYNWFAWEESRAVENLGLKDPEARERALHEGKTSGEVFDRAVTGSGARFYQQLVQDIGAALSAFDALDAAVGRQFGLDAPSLREIRLSLAACADIAERLLQKLGGAPMPQTVAPTAMSALPPALSEAHMLQPPVPVQHPSAAPLVVNSAIPAVLAPRVANGPIRDRQEAVQRLHEVADYFRMYEPHSPVAHLAERTAKWANMSLEQWLGSVIKDDNTLGQLRELLDVNSAP